MFCIHYILIARANYQQKDSSLNFDFYFSKQLYNKFGQLSIDQI